MIRESFKKIAERENGEFYFNDENIATGGGVRSPDVTYKVTFKYKSNEFSIVNRNGNVAIDTFNCVLTSALQPIAFEIENISHIKNLFLRKESRLKIKSENKKIEYFLNQNKAFKKLSSIAAKENFSPYISCKLDTSWNIIATYHLAFNNPIQVIEPMIKLYKNLIDEFDKTMNSPHLL